MPATLFDFNGVLVDDERVHLAAFQEVLAPLGVTLDEQEYVERYLGYDDVGAFRAILTDRGRPPRDTEVAALVAAKKPAYMRRAQHELLVFDGAAGVLRACAARGPVGIVSGALRAEIAFALARMGVASLVSFIVSAEDTAQCKPDPQGYHLAIAALRQFSSPASTASAHMHGSRVLVVEDSIAGVRAAKAAGLPCVGVGHSYPVDALTDAGADWVVTRIAEIDERWLDEIGHVRGR